MAMLTTSSAAIMGMGPTELVVILVILLVLFGGTKLPGLAKGLGQSIKEFKKASKEEAEAEKTVSELKKSETVSEAKKPETASRPGSN